MPLEREFHSLSWKLNTIRIVDPGVAGTKQPHSTAKGKEDMAIIMGSRVKQLELLGSQIYWMWLVD